MIGNCYLLLENYEKSTQFHTMSSDINPLDVNNFSTLSESLTLEGKYNASQEALKQSDILINEQTNREKMHYLPYLEFARSLLYIMKKDNENAYININKIKNIDYNSSHNHISEVLFRLYFALGDIDKGFEWYYKHVDEDKSPCFLFINDPICKNARKDKRYIKLLKEMKLYEYWKDSL
jgi:tetratricopeptide (TPR) repeat protein